MLLTLVAITTNKVFWGSKITMFTKLLTLFVSLTILTSCEAPLNLTAVELQANKSFQRSDRLQDITQNDSVQVIIGSFGVVLVSKNQGENWSRVQLNSQPTLIDIAVCPNNDLVALAVEGAIWRSTDNGANWEEKSLGSEVVPQAVDCAPDGKLWVVSSFSTFLSSSDNGETWNSQSLDEDLILSYIKFFTPLNAIATGEFGSLFVTQDGGESWQAQNPVPNDFYPIGTYFSNQSQGWVAGLSGKIISTSDGGKTWVNEKTPMPIPLYSLNGNNLQIFAVGALGTIYVKDLTKDDSSWHLSKHDNLSRTYLRGILVAEQSTTIVGGGGTLIKFASPLEGKL